MMKRSALLGIVVLCGLVSGRAAAVTFTPCGATGPLGPTQTDCNTAYGGNPVVSVTGGVQTWTLPATGSYTITAIGARGASGDSNFLGGRGASVSGVFNLSADRR